MEDKYFNLNGIINNPVRIFFLCGSYYNPYNSELKDKRIVLKEYIESLNVNYKCLILEDKFVFRNINKKLNYNDINIKSLKSIEVLTSLLSDKVLIFHESISTAAEIGLFSSDPTINNKMLILVPDFYSVEEEYMSGFLRLAYNNQVFPDYNIKTLKYYPGTQTYKISEEYKKYHTYFVGNEVGASLKTNLQIELDMSKSSNVNVVKQTKHNTYKQNISKYIIKGNILTVEFNISHFIMYLFSLFSIDEIKKDLREILAEEDDVKKKLLYKTISILKKKFNNLIYLSFKNEVTLNNFDNIEIVFSHQSITFSQVVSYFVYVLYGTNLIDLNIKKRKLSISIELEEISKQYSVLILQHKDGEIMEVLNFV